MNFKKLLETPKDKSLIIITIMTFLPFLIITLNFILAEYLAIRDTGYGILDYELAWTPDTVKKIFSAWDSQKKSRMVFMHYLDMVFIPVYGLFGAECIIIVSRKLEGDIQNFGVKIALTPFIAGIFDAIENINLLLMLTDESFIYLGCPLLASLCAVLKITFLVVGLCFIYTTISLSLISKNEAPNLYNYVLNFGGAIIIFVLLALWNFFLALLVGILYIIILYCVIQLIKKEESHTYSSGSSGSKSIPPKVISPKPLKASIIASIIFLK